MLVLWAVSASKAPLATRLDPISCDTPIFPFPFRVRLDYAVGHHRPIPPGLTVIEVDAPIR